MENLIYYLLGIAMLGIAYTGWKTLVFYKKDEGSQAMKDVSSYINRSSVAYLKASYKILSAFVVLFAILLFLQDKYLLYSNGMLVLSFIIGAILAALSGYLGINFISKSHARTAKTAELSSDNAFRSAFSGGMAMGVAYVSIAILGLSVLFMFYSRFSADMVMADKLYVISAYILGFSTVGLFDRVIAGVFATGINAAKYEVHKTEEAIPDNTAVNPVEIANTAGINVNNGSGIDMIESYLAVLVSAMLLGAAFVNTDAIQEYFTLGPVLLPLSIAAIGILSSITAGFFVKSIKTQSFWTNYRFAYYFSVAILATASFFIVKYMLPVFWEYSETLDGLIVITKYKSLGVFWSLFIGMAAGLFINFSTDYFTLSGRPVNKLIKDSFKGSSLNFLSGTSRGFMATFVPVIIILAIVSYSYYLADFYGIAMAALGFLANSAIVLSINISMPVTKNADTLAKMSMMNDETIRNTQYLTEFTQKKEIYVKSLTVVSAVLAALSLLSVFLQKVGVSEIEINSPWTFSFVFVGALLPFLFSSAIIDAVSTVTEKVSNEVKRQFEEIPELKAALDIFKKYFGDPDVPTQGEQEIVNAAEGKAQYEHLVTVAAYASMSQLVIPIVLAVAVPVLVGYFAGLQAIIGLLFGIIPIGFILAFTQASSAAAWNSAKNEIAAGVSLNGEQLDQYSEVYQVAKIGDEAGRVYRNATAPSLNVLIKISVIIALIIASAL